MSKRCAICSHPNAHFIDRDLAAECSIPFVSLKHFGDYTMLNALRRHKRSHIPRPDTRARSNDMGKNGNLVTTKEWLKRRDRGRKRPLYAYAAPETDEKTVSYVIATEPMRVKGVVYQAGAAIPESMWDPAYLVAALRVGTVCRKAS